MKWKQILLIVMISSGTALASVWGYSKWVQQKSVSVAGSDGKLPVNYAGFFGGKPGDAGAPIDFTQAANASVQAVVHIKTKIPAQKVSNDIPRKRGGMFDDWFDQFFDLGPQVIPEQRASGSGVLISDDGYIVTNNHVIDDQKGGVAEEINVTLHNKKSYKARLIGRDPSSDLAVLKIDATRLPYMVYGNSDEVKLGQWVLAVGYPLTLETTVTAGIVSAKGRAIGINSRQSNSPIESFIQTDAAVNQGNSGGALVNTSGQLIGINSAILAPSGTYAGYSFAIPVKLVKKIVNDIIEFGDVQRGYLGITYPSGDLSEEQQKELGFREGEGVYVSGVSPDGAAVSAGIKKGDIITRINNEPVSSGSEMSAQVANFRPGDKVSVTFKRSGKETTANVVLKAKAGNFDVVNAGNINDIIGGELATLEAKKAERLGIEGGVEVKKVFGGGPLNKARVEDGFVITSINDRPVKTLEELVKLLNSFNNVFQVKGIYPGYDGVYTFPVKLNEE